MHVKTCAKGLTAVKLAEAFGTKYDRWARNFTSVADPDPGSGIFLPPGSGIGFFRIPDPTITSASLKHFFYFEYFFPFFARVVFCVLKFEKWPF